MRREFFLVQNHWWKPRSPTTAPAAVMEAEDAPQLERVGMWAVRSARAAVLLTHQYTE